MKQWSFLLLIIALTALGFARPRDAAIAVPVSADKLFEEYLRPSQDTYVAIGVDEPQGHLGELIAGHKAVEHLTFIQFDLPDRGADAQILTARLELFCISVEEDTTSRNQIEVSNAIREWDEDDLHYRIKPNGTGPRFTVDLESCAAGGEWKVIQSETLLDVVNQWYDDKYGESLENNGFILGPANDASKRLYRFVATNGEAPPPLGKGPRLVVDFGPGVTTPTFTPSITPTASNTPTPTDTATPTNTFTPSPTPTDTATPTDTSTPSPTPTPGNIFMPLSFKNAEVMGVGSPTEVPTAEPAPTSAPTPMATDVP